MLCAHLGTGPQGKHSSGSPCSQSKVQAQASPSFSKASLRSVHPPPPNGFNLTAPNKPNFTKQPLESPWKLINALMKSLTALFA